MKRSSCAGVQRDGGEGKGFVVGEELDGWGLLGRISHAHTEHKWNFGGQPF